MDFQKLVDITKEVDALKKELEMAETEQERILAEVNNELNTQGISVELKQQSSNEYRYRVCFDDLKRRVLKEGDLVFVEFVGGEADRSDYDIDFTGGRFVQIEEIDLGDEYLPLAVKDTESGECGWLDIKEDFKVFTNR